jgi:hypothetical protein
MSAEDRRTALRGLELLADAAQRIMQRSIDRA